MYINNDRLYSNKYNKVFRIDNFIGFKVHLLGLRYNPMPSNRLVILTILIVSLAFFITPVLACYYPGPEGSSILVTVQTSDGTPIPGASVTLTVYNGSNTVTTVGPESTNDNGQFTFPGPSQVETGLNYDVKAVFYGDNFSVDCVGTSHSADSGIFTLSNNTQKTVDITIPGVTAINGGGSGTPTSTPCPTCKPQPTIVPIIPKGNNSCYPAMPSGWEPGLVVGVVFASDNVTPISGAYVAIVSAADPNVEYSCMYTDSNGFYQFNNVNSTANAAYEVYAAISPNCSVYSDPFQVTSGNASKINLVISSGSNPSVTPVPSTPTPTADPSILTPAPSNNTTGNATVNSTVNMDPMSATGASLATTGTQSSGVFGQIGHLLGSIISGILSI
jgi:hypothetical protein